MTLHSADLPDNVESERAKLRRVVDRVYRLLPKEPVSPVDHKFWVGQVKDYEAELDQARKSKAATAYRAHIIEASRRTSPPAERGAKLKPGGARRNPSPRRKHSILAARIYDRLFGRVPKVTRWHPLWADLHIAVDHIDRALSPGKARSLILTNQKNGLVSPYVEEVSEEYLKLSPMELLLENLPLDAKDFDLCFCEFEWVEAFELRSMYHLIHPRMKKHAKIMIYHSSSVLRTLQKNGIGVLTGIAPVFDTAVFYFSGSRASAKMADSYRKWIDGLGKYGDGPRRLAKHGKWMVANAPKAWLANRDAARYSPFEVSDMRTSFVMEIEVE